MAYAYKNDVLVDEKSLSIPLGDYGFSRGYTLFEFIRCYNGKPFRLAAHLGRLFQGITALRMPVEISKEQLEQRILTLIEKNGFTECTVKVFVTLGVPVKEVFGFSKCIFKPDVFILNTPFKRYNEAYPYDERYYNEGLSLFLAHTGRVEPEVKSSCYVSAIRQMLAPEHKGFDDLLYVAQDGLVTECSRGNIFFVTKGSIVTPLHGALGGITSLVTKEVLAQLNIPYTERAIHYTEIPKMDGAFMTSSTAEIMPIRRIENTVFDKGQFPLMHEIHRALQAVTQKECA